MSLNLLSIMDGSKVLSGTDMGYVCLMGIGIVFAGLVCIVLICSIMSAIFKCFVKETPKTETAGAVATQTQSEPIANKQEFIAAVSAAIAEDMGKDISAIRIKSIRKI